MKAKLKFHCYCTAKRIKHEILYFQVLLNKKYMTEIFLQLPELFCQELAALEWEKMLCSAIG
jgi:hypothetical protein